MVVTRVFSPRARSQAFKLVGSGKLPIMKFLGALGIVLLPFSRFLEIPLLRKMTLFTRVSDLRASRRLSNKEWEVWSIGIFEYLLMMRHTLKCGCSITSFR